MLQQDSSVAFAYGISAFALQILHCVFITFFTPLYFCVHRISSTSFYVGQLCYLVWNSINDPLIGNWSDTSAASTSVGRRIPALLYGGPLCALAFAAIWFPIGCFWGDCKAAPSDAVILFSFVAQTFIYDGFFTYLTLAHSSLLADLTASHRIRASFTRWQAIFSAVAALFGVVVAASLWQPSDLRPFRRWALLLATISAICFVWSARIIGKYEAQLRSSAELLTIAADAELKSTATARKSLLQYASDWFKLCTEVFQLSSFRWFVLVSSTQQFLCSFNNSMWIIFMDIFFGTWLVPWQRACLVASAFVVPHLNTVLVTPMLERVGTYSVVRMLFRVRFFGALFAAIVVASAAGTTLCTGCALWASRVWYGRPGADPMQNVEPAASTEVHLPLMVLFVLGAFLVFNRISTEAVCRLSNLVVADIVDEDRVQFQRHESRAASIFGLQALISKPQVSLAPMVGWWVLDMAGFQPAPTETVSSSTGTSTATSVTASVSASWLSELWAQFTSSLAFDAAAPAGVADLPALSEPPARSPTLLWAATALLLLVPLVFLSIQQLGWRRYTLHSARLRAVKYALRRLQQEHGDVSADAEAAEEEVLHQQDDVLELKEV